jgi:hypothetical protein
MRHISLVNLLEMELAALLAGITGHRQACSAQSGMNKLEPLLHVQASLVISRIPSRLLPFALSRTPHHLSWMNSPGSLRACSGILKRPIVPIFFRRVSNLPARWRTSP